MYPDEWPGVKLRSRPGVIWELLSIDWEEDEFEDPFGPVARMVAHDGQYDPDYLKVEYVGSICLDAFEPLTPFAAEMLELAKRSAS